MQWYAVRSFLRSRPTGRPRAKDAAFVQGVASIEERIVLFHARGAQSALRKGRAEVEKYARQNAGSNVYGQRVVLTPFEYLEAYEMFDSPASGVEVFSSIEIVSENETTAHALRRKVGEPTNQRVGRMFIAGRITRELEAELGRRKRHAPPN